MIKVISLDRTVLKVFAGPSPHGQPTVMPASTAEAFPDPMDRVDYKSTVFLPRTDFPMKAELARREPEILARWQRLGLFERLRERASGRPKFVLHDGPPYANGNIHIGTALNKILKDVINRAQQMLGRDANYVPGWDCHGLPIEWKIEERYREQGRSKDSVPPIELRQECRVFARHWIDVQREEFQRLGVTGDWENPYTTMSFPAEAQIVRELGSFLLDGSLYRGAKPVMWSVVEKTALAEAEVEYHDHTSTTIFVAFPVLHANHELLTDASVLIWTTTPWTIPGNRAIAYGEGFEYALFEVTEPAEGSLVRPGDRLLIGAALADRVQGELKVHDWLRLGELPGTALAGTVCRHPLFESGYDFAVPLLPADFVDLATGSGFVHIAPGHGTDDWELGRQHGIPVPETVGPDGAMLPHLPLFAGRQVLKADGREGDANYAVIEALNNALALKGRGRLVHSYPHSWRSKAPLIFRNTPQWFISMETTGLRDKALAAIDQTRFVPETGKNRLRGMMETRPDWCVSRQRAWGVPIAVFVDRTTGEPLRDAAVIERIATAFEESGADAWFDGDPRRFLGPEHDPERYEPVRDILDVWFDSGSTHAFVLEPRADLGSPADLYLEGSDQHRGWFHSSLLESCGTRGRAPYRSVLTHGFVMAEDGQKMSKSLGNVVAPQEVIQQHGADVLRLWVVSSDYTEDLRIGRDILKQTADVYRRFRNTFRYLLGNLHGTRPSMDVDSAHLPELERWILHRLWQLDAQLRQACQDLQFHAVFADLHTFCAVDLSAFYFDVRKDALYCDPASSSRRLAAVDVLNALFECLSAWLAPFLCFTAEEAWLHRHASAEGIDQDSVHLRLFPEIPEDWRDDALAQRWVQVRQLRRVMTGALERERAAKRIGSSLQARVLVWATPAIRDAVGDLDLAELSITSVAEFGHGTPPSDAFRLEDVPDVYAKVESAPGLKCERCWQVLEDVGFHSAHPQLCRRCVEAVEQHRAAAE